jgi:predicted DNA-binding WGR domain protein
VYQAGGSDKFWRAAVRGAELTVSYGRVGSTGQTLVKAFDSAERAAREMEKLVAEKLRKGYVEAAP